MKKVIKFLANYRQKSAYRWISYIAYIEIVFVALFLALAFKDALVLVTMWVTIFLFVILFVLGIIIGILQDKPSKDKTHIIHDLGFIISLCLIGYFINLCLQFGSLAKKTSSPAWKKATDISLTLYNMGNNCNNEIDTFASCFAKYEKYKNFSSIDNNVLVTQDNEKYTFHINRNCKNKQECYVDISNNIEDVTKPYVRVFIYHYPDNSYSWSTQEDFNSEDPEYIEF